MTKYLVALSIVATCSAGFAQSQTAAAQSKPWFSATKSAEGVWTISDNGSDNMYLVEGGEKALLIDTGLGVARLSAFVKTLTAKPVIVVNTHAMLVRYKTAAVAYNPQNLRAKK